MSATAQEQDRPSRALLIAALDALDREDDLIGAAYVALALDRVERRLPLESPLP